MCFRLGAGGAGGFHVISMPHATALAQLRGPKIGRH